MVEIAVILGVALFIGLLLILIPTRFLYKIFKPFTMYTFGIRYIRRRRDHVDTFTNFMLFFSVLFCLIYWILPFYQILYGLWLFFTFLCTFGQACKVALNEKTLAGKVVIYGVYLMFAFGIISTMGLLNNGESFRYISQFAHDVFNLKITNVYYYFTNPTFTIVVLQGFIFMVPLYCLWAQFKYMRLEETYKAQWLVTYCFKILFVCAFMFLISYFGFEGIKIVFQINTI